MRQRLVVNIIPQERAARVLLDDGRDDGRDGPWQRPRQLKISR
jgi:hypothetical protein